MAVVPLVEREPPPVDDLSRLSRSHRWCDRGSIAELRQGLAAIQGIDVLQHTPTVLGLLTELHVKNMQPGEAIRCLDGALARVDRLAERWFEAELYRLTATRCWPCRLSTATKPRPATSRHELSPPPHEIARYRTASGRCCPGRY
jgi:hypothetical protein